ncbi:MAG: hypothetical protein ACE5NW_02320 [Acidiferrobacterales bacterium]
MTRLTYLALILITSFVLLPPVALALHEIDHRYDVMGYVLDKEEKPIGEAQVRIYMDNRVVGYEKTNSQGFYKIRLHLHDPDLGKTLRVQTANVSRNIKVTFTPGDKKTKRVHYANFIDGKLIQRKLSRNTFPVWVYGAIAAIVIATAIMIALRRTRRMQRRHRQLQQRARKKRKR